MEATVERNDAVADDEKEVPDRYPLTDLKDDELRAVADDENIQDAYRAQAQELLEARQPEGLSPAGSSGHDIAGLSDLDLEELAKDKNAPEQSRAEAQRELETRAADFSPRANSKASELKGEAGEPVGEMPPGEPQDTSLPPVELVVTGDGQLAMKVPKGTKNPDTTKLKLKVPTIVVAEGGFKRGQRVKFHGELVIVEEGTKDVLDKSTKVATEAVAGFKGEVLDLVLDLQ